MFKEVRKLGKLKLILYHYIIIHINHYNNALTDKTQFLEANINWKVIFRIPPLIFFPTILKMNEGSHLLSRQMNLTRLTTKIILVFNKNLNLNYY